MNSSCLLAGGGLWLALFAGLNPASGQTNRTWNGSAGTDWFNPNNWTPAGVPAADDIVNVTNPSSSINLTAPVTIGNRFNWSGGALSGDSLTIATNGVLNFSGSAVSLGNTITNVGTVMWTGATNWSLFSGANGVIYNAGSLRSAGVGSTSINAPFNNTGIVTVLGGTLSFYSGGNLAGTFSAAAGTTNSFAAGAFTYSLVPILNGPGVIELTGGSLTLLTDVIPNLLLAGGTLSLSPGFQGGSITNLSVSATTLTGTNIITGNMNWGGGTAIGPLTVASNAVLNISASSSALVLDAGLTNAGTVNWSGGSLDLGCAAPRPIVNLPSGVLSIQCDQSLVNCGNTNAYFLNAGTVQKSVTTGTTFITVPLYNTGTVMALEGTFNFSDGGTLGGIFNAAAGTQIEFTSGPFFSPGAAANGPGAIQLTGGSLTLVDSIIPNLQLAGGTVFLGTNFQGGTITNLALAGSTLNGSYMVSGTLTCGGGFSGSLLVAGGAVMNWTGGTANGPLTVAANGMLNLSGAGTKTLQNALTNAGTVTWTGGSFVVNYLTNSGEFGQIQNVAGAHWNMQANLTLSGSGASFDNAGAAQSSGAGTTTITIAFYNTGSVSVSQGTLAFSGGGNLAGTFSAAAGTTIDFSGGSFTYGSLPVLNGPGAFQLTGGSLTLLANLIPNLQLIGGTVFLGTSFQGGTITNLTLAGSTLNGSYMVSGTLTCGGGFSGSLLVAGGAAMTWTGGNANGPLTVAANGMLNLSGSNLTTFEIENALTNAGTVNWLGGNLSVNGCSGTPAGPIVNLAGGLWNIQCDQQLSSACGSTNTHFQNAGMLQKSAGTNTTFVAIAFTNSGTVTAQEGTLNFSAGYGTVGGTLVFDVSGLGSFGKVSISGSVALGGTASLIWVGGYVPAISNSFAVLTYSSHAGVFTNLNLPPAATWQTSYGATTFSLVVADIGKLIFAAAPSGTNAGAVLAPAVVQVEDAASGNPVATSGVPVTIALNSGSGTLSGTLTQNTDSTGKATFGDLRINLAGVKTLKASAPASGLSPATTGSFTIHAAGAAQLGVVAPMLPPQQTGMPFSPALLVQVQDQFGNAVSNSTASITARLSSGGGGNLEGTTNVNTRGPTSTATFSNLVYNLASPTNAESVVMYFTSPGLVSATNNAVMVDFNFATFGFTTISLFNRNSTVQINPTANRGLFSWTVDGVDQVYQHWFWMNVSDNGAAPISLDTLGTALGSAYTSTNATVTYLGRGLSVTLGFELTGGASGSLASTLAETLTIQNTTGGAIPLQVFEYSDFDLAGIPAGDTVAFPNTNTAVQQGKGVVATETVQAPAPSYWEASWYDLTLTELDGGTDLSALSDQIIPQAPGDQTFAFQWNLTLGAGQAVVISLAKSIQPTPDSISIALSGGNVTVSWPTNSGAGALLQTTSALGSTASWTAVTNPPVTVNGQYQVSVPPAESAQFYRLFP